MTTATEIVRPEVLALFARFVRLNPELPADDPTMLRVLAAYEETMPRDD